MKKNLNYLFVYFLENSKNKVSAYLHFKNEKLNGYFEYNENYGFYIEINQKKYYKIKIEIENKGVEHFLKSDFFENFKKIYVEKEFEQYYSNLF